MTMKVMVALMLLVFSLPLHALSPFVDNYWVQETTSYQRFHLPGTINASHSFWRTGIEQ